MNEHPIQPFELNICPIFLFVVGFWPLCSQNMQLYGLNEEETKIRRGSLGIPGGPRGLLGIPGGPRGIKKQ